MNKKDRSIQIYCMDPSFFVLPNKRIEKVSQMDEIKIRALESAIPKINLILHHSTAQTPYDNKAQTHYPFAIET